MRLPFAFDSAFDSLTVGWERVVVMIGPEHQVFDAVSGMLSSSIWMGVKTGRNLLLCAGIRSWRVRGSDALDVGDDEESSKKDVSGGAVSDMVSSSPDRSERSSNASFPNATRSISILVGGRVSSCHTRMSRVSAFVLMFFCFTVNDLLLSP